jgi:hypothetical protein
MFMNISIFNALIFNILILFISNLAYSANFIKTNGKNFEIGIGGYAVAIDNGQDRNEFGGNSLSAAFVFNDFVAIRGQYYSVEHDKREYFDLTGFDVNAYFGKGLQSRGFKVYSGVGFYKETLEYNNITENITGAQISGVIGYNWSQVSLDLSISLRTVGDYADYFDSNKDGVTAASSSLSIAYRF